MDNYFSNIPLFKTLREIGIGACGTTRPSSKNFPKELKCKKEDKFEWGAKTGIVVDNSVLAVLWMDNAPVTMLSTIHNITGPDSTVRRSRRCPRLSSKNGKSAREVFNGKARAIIGIPKIIDDYNHFMGGVDISDQLRSYYSSQLKVRRNWMPLFFWLLDTTIVNSYLIYKKNGGIFNHRKFNIELACDLMDSGLMEDGKVTRSQPKLAKTVKTPRRKAIYISKHSNSLPVRRLSNERHLAQFRSRAFCILCRHKAKKVEGKSSDEKAPRGHGSTTTECSTCEVPLCYQVNRNCFLEYHTNNNIE
jgi:hypothetical protein